MTTAEQVTAMASPGELVRVVTEVLGVPESAVTQHDRNLVEAGRRTKGGRGRSAAKVTPTDAAALLIAVAGSSYVKDSVETLDEFGGLKVYQRSFADKLNGREQEATGTWKLRDLELPHLRELQSGHTLLDALTGLILSMADGSFACARSRFDDLPPLDGKRQVYKYVSGEVRLFSPNPQAVVRIQTHRWSEEVHYANNMPKDDEDLHEWQAEFERTAAKGDLRQVREFSFRTLIEVGACIGA